MQPIIALDLETTGLNPGMDAITEIGAVKFNEKRIIDEFKTLVNPNRPIPPMISRLTGITNTMVANASQIHDVIPEFAAFVGDDPVLGHNVQFDLSFLNKHNILNANKSIDTYELAAVLLPGASRYNLGALGQQLGIIHMGSLHRAFDDAKLTHTVYVKLLEIAQKLPISLIAEIVRLAKPMHWGADYLFQSILKAHSGEIIDQTHTDWLHNSRLISQLEDTVGQPLEPIEPPELLDIDEVSAILEHGGAFSKHFSHYEKRNQQLEMLQSVTDAISNSKHLMVEAGTGTGKSFAYLIPSALWAYKNQERVVISTNTINLQDQLINKDIPDLKEALNIDLKAVILKGRSNYLCPKRLEALRNRGPENVNTMRVLAKIMVWLYQNGSGDRNEINLNGPIERDVWMKLSAETETCRPEVCLSRLGGLCPYYLSKQSAQTAHLIVVNHALLLADVAMNNRVLPEYKYLIVDEGHHIESATTNALSYRINQSDLTNLFRELGGTRTGVLGRLLTLATDTITPAELAAAEKMTQGITDLAFRLEQDLKSVYITLNNFLEDQRDGRPVNAYGQQERIIPATRTQPAWTEVEIAWDVALDTMSTLLSKLQTLVKAYNDINNQSNDEFSDQLDNITNLSRSLGENKEVMNGIVSQPNPDYIYWLALSPRNGQISVNAAPLHIGPLMQKFLWHEKNSVIITSATLTANGDFDYIRNRLYAEEADDLMLGSPFDYENSVLLYIVNDVPEPNAASQYQRAVDQSLVSLATATDGKLLALYTSYTQLRKSSEALASPLSKADITVYEQGQGASANSLLENFKISEKAVLLGTRSFWEGVDVPGPALSIVAITKLPFDVPSDPIIAARSETFENPFNEYMLPEAILRFRQGFGRLIRSNSDRGVVVVYDKRVLSKSYGKLFLDSLPQCTQRIGSKHDLPKAAASWLNI
ncbi:MAG: DEAD/DEAH box helicase [Anaerolineaceae bacterium]|nr:DEAD/DEAH box helicase [Anaerolineaceae bacterium]